jgi:hypothetical protein
MEPRKTKQPTATVHEEATASPAGEKAPGVRFASKEEFDKAQRKTLAKHAGLFRRLAK